MTIVGARPQLIKAAPVSAALRAKAIDETIVHTGQHYDNELSSSFFTELGLPTEDHNLGVGSASHAVMTARVMERLEPLLLAESPSAVLVYGDTNSTLAGSLTAAKLSIPVAHVEAGMRSFNRQMAEEINRTVTDHLSTWHFCSNQRALENLAAEGITSEVFVVGDVMVDAVQIHGMKNPPTPLPENLTALALEPGRYMVMTCHRAENTDDHHRLVGIMGAMGEIAREIDVLFAVHPRTKSRLDELDYETPPGLHLCDPLPYGVMLGLVREAAALATDSGGLQKEAYLLKCPCVTLRDETEWVETVEAGWNILAGASRLEIVAAVRQMVREERPTWPPDLYGDGHTADLIADILHRVLAPGA